MLHLYTTTSESPITPADHYCHYHPATLPPTRPLSFAHCYDTLLTLLSRCVLSIQSLSRLVCFAAAPVLLLFINLPHVSLTASPSSPCNTTTAYLLCRPLVTLARTLASCIACILEGCLCMWQGTCLAVSAHTRRYDRPLETFSNTLHQSLVILNARVHTTTRSLPTPDYLTRPAQLRTLRRRSHVLLR